MPYIIPAKNSVTVEITIVNKVLNRPQYKYYAVHNTSTDPGTV